jgi:hypothetical protein
MSGQWTPGPWVQDKYGQLFGSDGKQVGVWGLGIAWVSREPVADANARLISAAPDLVEALSTVLIALEVSRNGGEFPDFEKWEIEARAALQKAGTQ